MKKQLLLLVLILLPLVASADESGKCGDNLIWTYTEATKVLTISGSGEMYYYEWYNDKSLQSRPWHYFRSLIEKVIILDGVTNISGGAFYGCSSLTSITIPNSVTSIGVYAFYNCSSLTSVTIPNSITTLESNVFTNCSSLTSVTIPNSVTRIDHQVFRGCSSLSSIVIPASATTIDKNLFVNCPNLTSVVVENGNPKYDSRDNCNAIIETATNKIINGCAGSFIPSTVTTIRSCAFELIEGLTNITIPDNVKTIEYAAFSQCSDLKYLTIQNGVTTIEGAAFEKTAIESIVIPASVTKINNFGLTGGNRLFSGCSNLTSIIVEKLNNVYDSRQDCNAIIEKSSNKMISGCKNSVIPNSVTSIGDYAFFYCSDLTSITIPNSVKSIGDYAFWECSGLTSVTIPNSVTTIGKKAFYDCKGLTSVTIPNSVTTIGESAFDEVDLTTVVSFIENPFVIGGKSLSWRAFSVNTFYNATLYVPVGTIDKYKATEGWKDFAHIVEGIPAGIKVVENTQNKNATIYDLNGVRQSEAKRGINILNGKKVVVK